MSENSIKVEVQPQLTWYNIPELKVLCQWLTLHCRKHRITQGHGKPGRLSSSPLVSTALMHFRTNLNPTSFSSTVLDKEAVLAA